MVLRQRIKNVITVKNVKVLDAFPKVEAACQEGSPVSGAGSFFFHWFYVLTAFCFSDGALIYCDSVSHNFGNKGLF